jgi:hypothetical protein
MAKPIPVAPHAKGLVSSRKRPTLKASPEPVVRPSVSKAKKPKANYSTSEEKVESDDDYEERWEAIAVV